LKYDIILNLLSSELGEYKWQEEKKEAQFYCPQCKHHKKKLNISFDKNIFHCWVCNYSGRGIHKLVNNNEIKNKLKELTHYKEFNFNKDNAHKKIEVSLPENFKSLSIKSNTPMYKNAYQYAIKRGLDDYYIDKYNLGYLSNINSKYANRLIIPSYDNNANINYFTARSIFDDMQMKYLNPHVEKNLIIPFELYISWDMPIILVEGMIDAIKTDYNAIPLLGNTVSDLIIYNILNNNTKDVFLMLDSDAKKFLYRNCEKLIKYDIIPYIVEIDNNKDPGEMKTDDIHELIQTKSIQCDFNYLMKLKIMSLK
jgi:DNA primase